MTYAEIVGVTIIQTGDSTVNQEDTERLQELEESFENGDLNKEDDEEEWEELQSLRAERRRVKGRSKNL